MRTLRSPALPPRLDRIAREGERLRTLLVLAAITLAGAALRLWLVAERPLMVDEGLTWKTATRPLWSFLAWSHHPDHPPLSFALVRLSLLLGHKEWALRLPSLVAGILCIPAAWRLGRRVSESVGLLLAALVAFDFLLISQSRLARMYSLLALLALLALERMDALIDRDERRAPQWLALGALLLAVTWTHYLGYVFAVVVLGTIAWAGIRDRTKPTGWSRLRPATLAAILPAAGSLAPLSRSAVRVEDLGGARPLVEIAFRLDRATLDTSEMARLVIGEATHLWALGPLRPLSPLLVLAALVGLAILARRSSALTVALVALGATILLTVVFGSSGRTFGIERYLIPWRLVVTIGLASLALLSARPARVGVAGVAFVVCIGGAWAAAPREPSGLFTAGELARSLAPEIGAGELVRYVPSYYGNIGRWYGLPVTSEGDPFPRRNDGSLAERGWLFAARAPAMGDPPGRDRPPDALVGPLAELEAAYGVPIDRAAIGRAFYAHGAIAVAFGPGSAVLRVLGEPRPARAGATEAARP